MSMSVVGEKKGVAGVIILGIVGGVALFAVNYAMTNAGESWLDKLVAKLGSKSLTPKEAMIEGRRMAAHVAAQNRRQTTRLLSLWKRRDPIFVADVQRYLGVQPTGIVGPETQAAIRLRQAHEKLPISGDLDSATINSFVIG